MVSLGMICEGITDQKIIQRLVATWLETDSIIDPLQPRVDASNSDKAITSGNWDQVFEYCAGKEFQESFVSNPSLHVIIHLDSDVFRSGEVREEYRFSFVKEDSSKLSTSEIVDEICNKLVAKMGFDFYELFKERILFAIAVDSTECWLMPFYMTGNKRSKTVNCIGELNKVFQKKFGFTIHKKNVDYYHTIGKPLKKKKDVLKVYKFNNSLEIFCNRLAQLPPINDEEE